MSRIDHSGATEFCKVSPDFLGVLGMNEARGGVVG
jgi:hypothetical protein